MKNNPLNKNYAYLRPRERFRLVLAAGARGDENEVDQLVKSSPKLNLSMPEHAPHSHAFDDVAHILFMELVDEAANYHEYWLQADAAYEHDLLFDPPQAEDDEELSPGELLSERWMDMALVAGANLNMKINGWKLFCERLTIPPFALWQDLPGWQRLEDALKMAEKAAFTEEGFLRWLNRVRPAGEPEILSFDRSPETVAAELQQVFEARVKWWGG